MLKWSAVLHSPYYYNLVILKKPWLKHKANDRRTQMSKKNSFSATAAAAKLADRNLIYIIT